MEQKANLGDCIIFTLISRFWEWFELMFLRLSWAEIIFFWYFVDLQSYSKQFELCILNIFHQKQLFFVLITELDLSWRKDHGVGSNDLKLCQTSLSLLKRVYE